MRILEYLFGVLLFYGVFYLGQWMTRHSHEWEIRLQHRVIVRKFFLYAGRIFQVVGAVWAFLDAVAVLVLAV